MLLEERFGVTVPLDELELDQFRTIRQISTFVGQLMAAASVEASPAAPTIAAITASVSAPVSKVTVSKKESCLSGKRDAPASSRASRFTRRAMRGQCFHQPCLGTREFAADFALLAPSAPLPEAPPEARTAELGFGRPRDLGFMLWDLDHGAPGRPSLFFRASLVDGVMEVPQPGSPEVRR